MLSIIIRNENHVCRGVLPLSDPIDRIVAMKIVKGVFGASEETSTLRDQEKIGAFWVFGHSSAQVPSPPVSSRLIRLWL